MKINTVSSISIVLLLIGFVSYFIIVSYSLFKGIDTSVFEQLSHFATYQNYFLTFVNLILVGFISYLVYKTTNTFNEYQMSPVLDFTVGEDDHWYLLNCSNAAARNISIRFKIRYNESNNSYRQTKWIACYSLNGNKELKLIWLKHAYEIEVVFCDPLISKYYWFRYSELQVKDRKDLFVTDFNEIMNNRLNSIELAEKYTKLFFDKNFLNKNTFIFYLDEYLANE